MTNFTDLQTKRRSIYALGKDVELSNQELIDTIQEAVLNNQLLLTHKHHVWLSCWMKNQMLSGMRLLIQSLKK